MPFDAKRQILRRHPRAIIADPDEGQPTNRRHDLDALSPGVNSVLDQFLDDARRPFDDLARRNPVDGFWRELADRQFGPQWFVCYPGVEASRSRVNTFASSTAG